MQNAPPSPQTDPDWCPVAFKEWQFVAEAIADGEQSVLLRKGGISEGKMGFQWLHERFFLFPSLFHEQAEQVKLDARGALRVPTLPSGVQPDDIVFSVYVETVATGRLADWDEVRRLEPYHIWREEIVRERFEWGEEPGIAYALVRAWRLSDPWVLKDRATFGGCRSWFGLPQEEGGGWRDRLAGAQSVKVRCGYPEWLVAGT